jgi:cytochrome c-type biogenesis protein CcmH/NrfF
MRVGLRTLVVALSLALLAPASVAAQQAPPSLPDLEDEVMCPTCGFSLALSESPQASQIRDLIRSLIDEGLSKEQIKDALVVEYGPEVLATPETSGFDLAAWVVPGLAILIAGGALSVGIRRWRSASGGPAASGPVEAEDEERLAADLDRYRL